MLTNDMNNEQMASVLMISLIVLSHSKVRRSADHSSNNSEHLYSMLQGVITDRMTQLETSETEKATTDSEDLDMIVWACFARVYTQDESKSGKTDANVAEIAGSDQSISARPRWRISLLYWATHCALETADAQEFRHRLEEGGATLQEPFIVKLFTWKYRLDHFEGIVSKVLNREESTRFTKAWRQAFPNYTIPLFPRLINAMLMILHNGRFLRNDGPLRANELLRAGKIISDSFERRKAPNVDMVLRTAERLQDVGFLSSEGLLWATQILRTGRLFWDNGLISADSLFTTQPLLTAGVSSSTEAVLRGAEIIRDNGWIGDLSLLSSSALASNGQPLFTNEFPQAYDLFCDNELSPHGPSKACTFM